MARYNEILAGHFNRGLFKLLAMKGEAPSPQIASEIMPVLPLPLGAEYRVLDSWERWGALIAVTAVAAQFSAGQLRNDKASNVIAVVEKISVQGLTTTAVNFQKTLASGDFSTILIPRPLDGRQNRQNSSIIASQGTQAGGLGAQVFQTMAIAQPQDLILTEEQELVLAPGEILTFINAVVNLTLTVAVWWRERFLEDSERAV